MGTSDAATTRLVAWCWLHVNLLALQRTEYEAFLAVQSSLDGLCAGRCLLSGTFFFAADGEGALQLHQVQGYAAAGGVHGMSPLPPLAPFPRHCLAPCAQQSSRAHRRRLAPTGDAGIALTTEAGSSLPLTAVAELQPSQLDPVQQQALLAGFCMRLLQQARGSVCAITEQQVGTDASPSLRPAAMPALPCRACTHYW
jgi:hypothetical protein